MALDTSETPQHKLWLACVERLAQDMSEQQFNTWIRPLQAQVADDLSRVTILVANRFKMDWIRTQYAARLTDILSTLAENEVVVELTLASRQTQARRATAASASSTSNESGSSKTRASKTPSSARQRATETPTSVAPALNSPPSAVPDAPRIAVNATNTIGAGTGSPLSTVNHSSTAVHAFNGHRPASVSPMGEHHHRLNPDLTFATLVEGSANRMARAASLHVSRASGQMYNPLFIYGGVGLGKTHLTHAIGNELLLHQPDAKVLYIHAEQFVTDVVKSSQRKTFDDLKARYHSLDLLLIDEVQFFANKDRTQEEFFNAFEALLAPKRAGQYP
jgi:chromosomal replication initiator protein